jgi:hypothetical protein
MSYARQLPDTSPRDFHVDAGVLAATIDALNDCARAGRGAGTQRAAACKAGGPGS